MEGMKGWTRYQSRLVRDPKVLDTFEIVGKNNTLMNAGQFMITDSRWLQGVLCSPAEPGTQVHTFSQVPQLVLHVDCLIAANCQI